MKKLFALGLIALALLASGSPVRASASNWLIYMQADMMDGTMFGATGQVGVKPLAEDGVDTLDGSPIDLGMYSPDTRCVVNVLGADIYGKSFMSTASYTTYPNAQKIWPFRISQLTSVYPIQSIRFQFKTSTSTATRPPAAGANMKYYVKLVNNRGMGVVRPTWASSPGTPWTPGDMIELTVPSTNNTYFGELDLPRICLSSSSSAAMLSEGYAFEFIQTFSEDASPPSQPTVTDDGSYTGNTGTLHASWLSVDPESGIAEFQYAIGTSQDNFIVAWKSAGSAMQATEAGLSLQHGETYYWYVKARNWANLWSDVGASDGIYVDTSQPSRVTVIDEGTTTGSPSSLQASWSASTDPESSIAEYQYAIGTSPTDLVLAWKSAALALQATESTLTLQPGLTYFWYVKAKNGAGLWGDVGASDGIYIGLPATLSEARTTLLGSAVVISGLTVSSKPTDAPGLWADFDRACGVKIPASWTVDRGKVLQVAGVVSWMDGVPVLTSPYLVDEGDGSRDPLAIEGTRLANDKRETLDYVGVNPVGLLFSTWGWVTRLDTANHVFYIDDGSHMADGMGPSYDPFIGLRVAYKAGMSPPLTGKYVVVTGIRTVEKTTLVYDAVVNGQYRFAGETLYLPVLAVRDSDDIVTRK